MFFVGPALAAVPSRNECENRNGAPASGGPTLRSFGISIVVALLLAASLPSLHAATDATPKPALHTLSYSGDQQPLAELDRDITAAGTDSTKLDALAQRLLQALRRSESTFAGRQAICERLGLVLAQAAPKNDASAYKPLATMLVNERDSDLARLALERAPGAVVDGMFVTALGKTTDRTRIGIIGSLARRRALTAVKTLGGLLKDADVATATAIVKALGAIGTSDAVAALRGAPTSVAHEVASAKIAAAPRLRAREASLLLRTVQNDTALPAHLRAAAFRTSLALEPDSAGARIVETLGGSEAAMKQVALEAAADLPAANLDALSAGLTKWDPITQAAVLTLLGRRAHASALTVVSTSAAHADPAVRAAAIAALGMLPGNRETAALLTRLAVEGGGDDAKAARTSLARLKGREVALAILAGAGTGTRDAKVRAVYLEQLALRNMTEGLPLLLDTRRDPDATIRTAAAAALGDLGAAKELPALLDWTIDATDETEQSRALRSVVNVALRNPNADERGREVFAAIEKAKPEIALRLLPALPRIGGKPSAESAARLALRDDAKISDAAVAALVRWSDATALPSLATVAEKAERPAARKTALEAALRYLEKNREPWSAETGDVIARLLRTSKDAAARKRLVALLTRANDQPALALAESHQSDPAIGERARYAAAVIRANLAGEPALRGSNNPSTLKNMIDGKTSTRWSANATGEEWIEIDFKISRPMEKITLDQTGRANDFPERYEVYVTDDPATPGEIRASGQGQRTKTLITLPAGTTGRYLIIRNTKERVDGIWAVCELFVE